MAITFTPEQEARYARLAAESAKITPGNGTVASNAPSTAQIAVQRASTPSATYVTNNKGQTTSQYNQNGATYNVLKDSWADPLSSNYSAILNDPNRPAGLTLADLDSSSPTGISLAFNGTPGSGASNSAGYLDRIAAAKGVSVDTIIKQMGSAANNQTLANGQVVGSTYTGISGSTGNAYSGSGAQYGSSGSYYSSVGSASDLISQQAQQQMAAQAAAIKAAKDKQVSDYNAQISAAPQTYQPKRNEASFAGAKNLQGIKEQMASQGLQNSGDNVSANIQANTATQNNINALNQDELNYVNQLKKAISDANASADSQTLQSNATINAQKLQALIDQQNADRTFNYQASQDTIANNLAQQTAANNQAITDANLKESQTSALAKEAELVVAANYTDISAERDRRMRANPNDPMLPYLQAAINQKVADQKSAQAAAETAATKVTTAAQQTAFDNALALWKINGIATQAVANVLGVKVGAKTADYNLDSIKAATSAAKASSSSNKSSSSSTASTKALNNTYQEALTQYNSMDPGAALNNLKDYANNITAQIGSANYNKLVSTTQERLYQTMLSNYNDFPAVSAYSSVANNRDHIISQIGAEYYNKLLTAQQNRYNSMIKANQ